MASFMVSLNSSALMIVFLPEAAASRSASCLSASIAFAASRMMSPVRISMVRASSRVTPALATRTPVTADAGSLRLTLATE
ncbi:hypothetical protein CQB05_10645 [Paracidovorax citrulli]|nr:hypothetical protein CQB05_10645 [Paracidovorax citrulli]